ncbi:MAG TPA: hypothetical protein VGL86_33805 [Polyangia bacterium]
MEHDPTTSERTEEPAEIDANGILALDGMQASQAELARARVTAQFLEALLPSLVDDGDAAQALHDVAALRSYPLDDAAGALESIRAGFARRPALHVARAYRKAAIRGGSLDDQLAALEGEIKLAPTPAYRAALETERGGLYERAVGNLQAARQSYAAAVEINPSDVTALLALLRLALRDGDRPAAAAQCKKIADAVGDPRVKAEFLAWAGRLYDAAGSSEAALAAAVQGEVHAADSPSVRFLLERLYAADDAARELGAVVERGLRDGSVAAPAGWFDLGYLYRYRLGDAERAEKAFGEALAGAGDDAAAKAAILAELSELAAQRGDWARVVALELERLDGEKDPAARAPILARIGQVREERLDDLDGAASVYTQAIEADAAFLPALEGAGRVFIKRGSVDKLVWMHRAEAAAAPSPVERAGALVRAGELLVADAATVDEGIVALEEARAAVPAARAVFDSLELALRRKGAYEKLAALYRHEVDRGVEARRAAWLLTQIGELAALRLGDTKRAIEAFSIAAGIEGDGPRFALSRLAQLLEDADAPAELEAVLARLGALTEDPGEQASLLERAARLQERRGDLEAALASYRRALELAPSGHTVYAAAGRAFHRAERWADLLTLFERAMLQGDAPERAHYAYRAGLTLARKLGRVDEGIEYLHEAIALDPKHRGARVALAALYTEAQRWTELGPVLAELPPSPSLLARRAALAEAGGRHEEALALWQGAQAAGLSTTAPAQARLFARLGRWNELAELHERAQSHGANGNGAGGNGTGSNGAAGKLVLTARYRAAELRHERLGQAARAVELLAAAVAGEPDSVPLLLAHERALDDGGPARRDALKALVARTRDPALRVALLAQLAATLTEGEVVATRLNQMALSPRDPIITVRIEQTLESRRNREGLAALLRDQRRDPKSDPLLLASMDVQLGGLYEELGSLREAVDAFEAALASPQPSLLARLALPRLYSALGDEARAAEALTRLAEALPAGAERAAALRKLAGYHRDRGDSATAVATFEAALQANPRDYAALRALDILTFAGEPERLIDPLMRAFAAEPAGAQRSAVGTALAVRLLRANRMAPAREVLEQVLADDAAHLNALVLGAELELRGEAWSAAAPALEAVAAHPDAAAALAAEALRRLARVQLEQLDDVAAARATAARLAALAANDLSSLELRLVIAERADDHAEAAQLLAALIAHPQLDDDRRAQLQLQLASLQEVKLDDVAAAIQTLGQVKLAARRRDAVDRLFDLGGRTNRWDLAASALEATLDRAGAMDPPWELAIRGRLANLLEGPLERRDAAARQYERIVALDRGHVPALERLAELSAATAPDKAIEYHRALLATEPRRLTSYRALRQLFLVVGDEDAAFVTEALLEAVGVADEEEAYFYRQRRARLGGAIDGALTEDERALIAPEVAAPAFALVHALTPALATVFPIDMAGYGVAGEDGAVDPSLQATARAVARLFGVEGYKLYAVPNRVGPCVEPGTPPALFVPRNVVDAIPREQQGVLGELMARVSFDALLADPRRLSPTTPALLEQLLWAACELSVPGCESPLRGRPVYEDIKRRLDKAAPARSEMGIAASLLLADGDSIGGEQILAAMNRVAVRAAMLTSQDPAAAIAYQLAHRGSGGGKGLDALPPEILAVLPFVVSRGHLAIRKRLGIGVHP